MTTRGEGQAPVWFVVVLMVLSCLTGGGVIFGSVRGMYYAARHPSAATRALLLVGVVAWWGVACVSAIAKVLS